MTVSLRKIKPEDFARLNVWQSHPHVKDVWDDDRYEEPYLQYIFRTADNAVKQFIIEADGASVGYFQFYWASQVGGGWWEGFDSGTVGIDFYVGEPGWLGKGLGSKILDAAVEMLFKDPNVRRIIADPSPENGKIIHLLKKAGFESLGEIESPDGRALLTELRRV